jgi:hypothetical protein
MAITIPNTWTLNFRGLDFLNAELTAWENKAQNLFGADKTAALQYIEIVRAERDQRRGDYLANGGGLWAAAVAGFKAPFEALGGAGGPGAAGASSAAYDTVAGVGGKVSDFASRYTIYVLITLAALAAFWIYLRRGK